ncbi:MAG: cupin domain-containing protein [Terriglobales bacterium]
MQSIVLDSVVTNAPVTIVREPEAILMASASTVELAPHPIPKAWILSGNPVARSRSLSRSRDLTSSIVVWDCTPGRFHWHYSQDETILVISGEAFMMSDHGQERRFGPGDIGFFPAGTTRTWRVGDDFRKVAVLKENVGRPLGFCLKAWKKLVRLAGFGSKLAL